MYLMLRKRRTDLLKHWTAEQDTVQVDRNEEGPGRIRQRGRATGAKSCLLGRINILLPELNTQ